MIKLDAFDQFLSDTEMKSFTILILLALFMAEISTLEKIKSEEQKLARQFSLFTVVNFPNE